MERWVQVKGGDDPVQCDLSKCTNVHQLLMLVKATVRPRLDTVGVDQMKLFEQEDHKEDPTQASELKKKPMKL
eukprot:3901801-Amphidinium_carterae.1